MKRIVWTLMALAAWTLAGCSDDNPTEPIEGADPLSRLGQIHVLSDGAIHAVGVEGSDGMIYVGTGETWQPADPPLASSVLPTGVLSLGAGDTYVYDARARQVLHREEDQWVTQPVLDPPSGGAQLKRTPAGLWLLALDESWLGAEDQGAWSGFFVPTEPGDFLADLAEDPQGSLFVTERGPVSRVHRIDTTGHITTTVLDATVHAAAADDEGSVWLAGRRLWQLNGAAWDTLCSIPDSNLVTTIARLESGGLTLVCSNGVIYRWQDDQLNPVQEDALIGDLQSVGSDATRIVGTLNITDRNTGHETGLVVRFDGTQWVTDYLAPPATPE